jgi:hypothetical protein
MTTHTTHQGRKAIALLAVVTLGLAACGKASGRVENTGTATTSPTSTGTTVPTSTVGDEPTYSETHGNGNCDANCAGVAGKAGPPVEFLAEGETDPVLVTPAAFDEGTRGKILDLIDEWVDKYEGELEDLMAALGEENNSDPVRVDHAIYDACTAKANDYDTEDDLAGVAFYMAATLEAHGHNALEFLGDLNNVYRDTVDLGVCA